MNQDCIFSILYHLKFNDGDIINCLLMCKLINKLNTDYLWKLLCEREYNDVNMNIKNLYCGANKLTEIPTQIGNCVQLINIDFSNNELKVIPSELGKLVNLTKLRLDGNKLKNVPNQLGNLSKLEFLKLDRNELT